MRFGLLILFGLMTQLGCYTTKPLEDLKDEDITMKITKGACFGNCPIYTLYVYQGGYTILDASRFGLRQGKYYKRLNRSTYKSLKAAYDAAEFYSLPDKYESQIADFPLISLYYKTKRGEKYVRGKDRRPQKVMAIQKIFDEIYEEDNWKLLEAPKELVEFEPEKPHDVVQDRSAVQDILVKPKKNIDFEEWLKGYGEYGMKMVKQISKSMNVYLVTYDSALINGNILLRKIKKDKSIETAQFDREVSLRTDR